MFSVVTYGTKVVEQYLKGVAVNARDIRPALDEIYVTILDIEEEAFEKEGARSGFPPWEPLTLSTVLRKLKRGGDPRILRETNDLMRSVTRFRDRQQYARIERDKIVFSSRRPFARVHQEGKSFTISGRNIDIPARPFIRFSQTDSEAFGREILRHVTKRRPGVGTTRNVRV